MTELSAVGLANTATGFAILFNGGFAWYLSCRWPGQPRRWQWVYVTIFVTGVFTVTLHGFGETCACFGERWFWAFLDTGSNLVVTYAIALALSMDLNRNPAQLRRWQVVLTAIFVIGISWHFYDRLPSTPRGYAIPLGEWGGFYPGEACLVVFSWLNLFLFVKLRHSLDRTAQHLLWLLAITFFIGMLLASASSSQVVAPFFAVHALWHLVAALGFLWLWAFNHQRFGRRDATR